MGRVLGAVRLGMSAAEVRAVLGEPATRTTSPGTGAPRWEYPSGLAVDFFTEVPVSDTVSQLVARPPFAGKTEEGAALGMDVTEFRRPYAQWIVQDNVGAGQGGQVRAVDPAGTGLLATFDGSGRATLLQLFVGR